MSEIEKQIERLEKCIKLEEDEQLKRFDLNGSNSLKELKSNGLVIHPIQVTRKTFGYADYPEIEFRSLYSTENSQFRDGGSIECFFEQDKITGQLLQFDGRKGIMRLFAPDFPDWIEDKGVGIKASIDDRTIKEMRQIVQEVKTNKILGKIFHTIHSKTVTEAHLSKEINLDLNFYNKELNFSQQHAIKAILSDDEDVVIVHGPPGTGKTTTIVESIYQLALQNKKIIVSAPSNAAVDLLALKIKELKINFLRLGNQVKVHEEIFDFTPEGLMKNSKQLQEIKKLRIRADEMRKMANQYKRRFGKDERDQRNLLMNEVRSIRKQMRDLQSFYEDDFINKATVILGTPIGLSDSKIENIEFDVAILDEAGQCLEPLAYLVCRYSQRIILAGDHLQLPPTVLSEESKKLGFDKSILDLCYLKFPSVYLLDTQYRMKEPIIAFSNKHFYANQIKSPDFLQKTSDHVFFFDTAGAGFEEEPGEDGNSLMNKGEIDCINQLIEKFELKPTETIFISPYSGQVSCAREFLPKDLKKSTIDSFQGQEATNVIISLVRSNNEGNIGFLKDYRRMNVAMTRAKENLFIIGDSLTLSKDKFYNEMINHFEGTGSYKSIWEILY